jgi:hypothetical protein
MSGRLFGRQFLSLYRRLLKVLMAVTIIVAELIPNGPK